MIANSSTISNLTASNVLFFKILQIWANHLKPVDTLLYHFKPVDTLLYHLKPVDTPLYH